MSLRSVFLRRWVNRSTTTSFPSINEATKHAVVIQRQVLQKQTSRKTGGSPAGAVRRDSCGRAFDQADQPGDQACRDSVVSTHRRGAAVPADQPGDQARRVGQWGQLRQAPWRRHRQCQHWYLPETSPQSIRDLRHGPVRTGHCNAPLRSSSYAW